MDANFNRSREGLRVCEEITRFVLDSKPLTVALKSVRHGVTGIKKVTCSASSSLMDSRDVEGDVGRTSRLKSEKTRKGIPDIFSANIERVKESLRVLEEFSKLIDVKQTARLAKLRFRVYAIEKNVIKKLELF
jgi:thiamine-phosphate pyrophosphorylase